MLKQKTDESSPLAGGVGGGGGGCGLAGALSLRIHSEQL